jgi:hypothetical protein
MTLQGDGALSIMARLSSIRQMRNRDTPSANRRQTSGCDGDAPHYAVASSESSAAVKQAIVSALRRDSRLENLRDEAVTIVAAEDVGNALEVLSKELSQKYVGALDRRNFGLAWTGGQWRAGLAFLPGPQELAEFAWPVGESAKVIVLKSSGAMCRFLKREEETDEDRITFGDPTTAVDEALTALVGQKVTIRDSGMR